MGITAKEGEGLVVPMDYYLRLRRRSDGADFWDSRYQDFLTKELEPFLPRMEYNPIDNTVAARLFWNTSGQGREEMLGESINPDNPTLPPEKALNVLRKKVADLLRKVDKEKIDLEMKHMVEAFALPDPQKSPELYQVYGKNKLAVLWGLEKNPGESISLRDFVHPIKKPPLWRRILRCLLLILVFVLGALLCQKFVSSPTTGKDKGNGTGQQTSNSGDNTGTSASPKDNKDAGKPEPSNGSASGNGTVSEPGNPRGLQTASGTRSGREGKQIEVAAGNKQTSTPVSPVAPPEPGAQNGPEGTSSVPVGNTGPDVYTRPTPTDHIPENAEKGVVPGTGAPEHPSNETDKAATPTPESPVRNGIPSKDARVELPVRTIDIRVVGVHPGAAPGKVRVSVQVSVSEGADYAVKGGEIGGMKLDVHHPVEIEIDEHGKEVPYKIELSNSEFPVTGGCKIILNQPNTKQ